MTCNVFLMDFHLVCLLKNVYNDVYRTKSIFYNGLLTMSLNGVIFQTFFKKKKNRLKKKEKKKKGLRLVKKGVKGALRRVPVDSQETFLCG